MMTIVFRPSPPGLLALPKVSRRCIGSRRSSGRIALLLPTCKPPSDDAQGSRGSVVELSPHVGPPRSGEDCTVQQSVRFAALDLSNRSEAAGEPS